MLDMRKKASMSIDENNIKMLLTTIGINPTTENISTIIGFLNTNGLELTMSNLLYGLKSNSIIAIQDCRKRTITGNSKVHVVNMAINNYETFNNEMYNLGYTDFTNDFLMKNINDININISRNQDSIQAITGYDLNNNIVQIPEDVLNIVLSDIETCNK